MVPYYMQDYPDEYTFHPRSYHIVPPALRGPSSRRSTVHRRRRRRHSATDVPQQYLDHRMSPSGTALSDPYYQSGHYMDNEDSEYYPAYSHQRHRRRPASHYRPPSYNIEDPRYDVYDERASQTCRISSDYSHSYDYYDVGDDPGQGNDEEEEFDSPTEQERLATENAMKNKTQTWMEENTEGTASSGNLHGTSSAVVASSAGYTASTPTSNSSTVRPSSAASSPPSQNGYLRSTDSVSAGATTELFSGRRRWSVTSFLKRMLLPKSILRKTTGRTSPMIRTVLSTGPASDVLDQEQQRDILQQLTAPPSPSLNQRYSSEAVQVASLDFIWVFRLKSENDMPVWTGFDLRNQALLSKHYQEHSNGGRRDAGAQENDPGVELFDSHIRQGQLPVLVLPSKQLGYYPLDMQGNEIGTLQVACMVNGHDVQFVYRT